MGCPIRNRTDQSSHAAPRSRFAGLRVLHRLLAPRHPPCTLRSLAALRQVSKIEAIAQFALHIIPASYSVFTMLMTRASHLRLCSCSGASPRFFPAFRQAAGIALIPGCDSGAPRSCGFRKKPPFRRAPCYYHILLGACQGVSGNFRNFS